MNPRHKGAVKEYQLQAHFPVRITFVIGLGLPLREWGIKYSLMRTWLTETVGGDRHAVLSGTAPGRPDAMQMLFASLEDARAFVEHFEIPLAPIGRNPRG